MNMLHLPELHHFEDIGKRHFSVARMFFLYALPLSLVPPLMFYEAGMRYSSETLFAMNAHQLQFIGLVFFITETAMLFLMAGMVQRLGAVIDIAPSYEDAFKLSVLAPTPLWLAPLALFVPSFTVDLTVGALALILPSLLVYYAVPGILKVEDTGKARLLAGSISAAGMVGWAAMMYVTLLTWNVVTSSLPL